jgi:hypothetical protein
MKRLLLLVAALAVAAVTIPVAGSVAAGPKMEKADGTGESPMYGRVHVNAKDQGGDPQGHFFIGPAMGPVEVQGDVTCITQTGNRALVGGFDRQTGMPYLIEVIDNGQPGAGADQHRWRPAQPDEVSGPDCNDQFSQNQPRETIVQGNYVVPTGSGG